METSTIITLTTDFGLADPYVAMMKGVILNTNPSACIVDLSHSIQPRAIEQGAFLLNCAIPYFRAGSIHVAVVDPGVGSDRRAIAVRTPKNLFVGPDNGILSTALPDKYRPFLPGPASLPSGWQAVSLENERYFRSPISTTFHGRDIFAPVAAHLSQHIDFTLLGPPINEIQALPLFRAIKQKDGTLEGRVLHIDHFGNLITDILGSDITDNVSVEISGQRLRGIQQTYSDGIGLVALIGSYGYLEIARVGDSAAATLNAKIGMPVVAQHAC